MCVFLYVSVCACMSGHRLIIVHVTHSLTFKDCLIIITTIIRYALLLSCWESKSESRPRFSEIVCTLENHLMNNSGYIDLRALKTSVSEDDIQNEDDVIENQIHATLNDYCIAGI